MTWERVIGRAVAGSIVLYDRFVKAEMSVWGHAGGAE